MEMYDYIKTAIKDSYESIRLLRSTSRSRIELIRHKTSGNSYILREYTGSNSAYSKLSKIHSQHIPLIYETAQKDEQVLVLEEYIVGDTLQSLLSCGPLDPRQVRDISSQLCDALWVLHKLDLVHRDIKPENVMIRGKDVILIDFDASRLYNKEKSTDTMVLGTVGYAPPEQYGISQTDPRSDIYSLGVLMNVMLTGVHPSIKMASGRMGIIIRRCTMINSRQRFDHILQVRALL